MLQCLPLIHAFIATQRLQGMHTCLQGVDPPSPLCIIHGPFGSGKSSTLVAMIHFFAKQLAKQGSKAASARVLVAAHTNVAVDRVLTGLLDTGFTSAPLFHSLINLLFQRDSASGNAHSDVSPL